MCLESDNRMTCLACGAVLNSDFECVPCDERDGFEEAAAYFGELSPEDVAAFEEQCSQYEGDGDDVPYDDGGFDDGHFEFQEGFCDNW